MKFLPDTNACITLLRQRNANFASRWKAQLASDVSMCSVVVYELRYGAERSSNSAKEHSKLDAFLHPYVSLPFDDISARTCGRIRRELELSGTPIGPHDLQIAAIALQHGLTLVTHNTREFSRIRLLKIEDWEI